MILANKKILIISPQPWDHIFVSKHHYSIELGKRGNKVYFLGPPSVGYDLNSTKYENVYKLEYQGFIKGLAFFPKFIRRWILQNTFRRLEKLAHIQFDIIWSFDNSVFYDFDSFSSEVLKISHIVDLNQNYNMERASFSADVCFGVIPEIVRRHQKFNKHSYLIRHAVSVQPISKTVQLPGHNNFKTLYIGNLGMRHLDWDLVSKAAKSNKEVDFVFIGPNKEQIPFLLQQENIFMIGPVPAEDLGSYMEKASLLILFYKQKYYSDYASPHKLLEYLSSGKPVLTYEISEYSYENDIIEMVPTEEKWLFKLREIKEKYDSFCSPVLSQKRKDHTNNNSYSNRIDEIEKILQKCPI